MYSDLFCKVYNEFGWNYYPEAFGEQLLLWLRQKNLSPETSMDLACGTGILCEVLAANGIKASGMDFSEGMIEIARQGNPDIHYDIADMILFRPEQEYDLVTCTGDALNHILDIHDVRTIFENVYAYTSKGGYFIFDILNEKEVSDSEPFDLEFSETVTARFQMLKEDQLVRLKIAVYEDNAFSFEEVITETVHDLDQICEMLKEVGFTVLQCSHQLQEDAPAQSTTWYIIAQKQ